jgi:hypothetical protein
MSQSQREEDARLFRQLPRTEQSQEAPFPDQRQLLFPTDDN